MWYNIFKISQNQTFGTYRIFIFSARLTTLDRATVKVVLSIYPSLCTLPIHFTTYNSMMFEARFRSHEFRGSPLANGLNIDAPLSKAKI